MSFKDQLDYSKYFPHFGNELLVGLAILVMFLLGLSAVILIYKNKMTKKVRIILLSISFFCGGILFGGFPNVIFLTGLTFLILALSLLFGRVFCGYICPLGAGQEILSMVRFKTNLFYESESKKKNNLVQNLVRWALFSVFIVLILLFSFEIMTPLNPLNGFLFVWFPFNYLYLIALILLFIVIITSIFIYRPFCRYVCPFGAIMSLIGRFSIIKIRRTNACLDCGLCEKICPTLEGFRKSKKGECYLCYRCVEFCSKEMCINPQKISQISKQLTTYSLLKEDIPNGSFFDKIIKSLIRLISPKKCLYEFNELMDALEGKRFFSMDSIQNIIIRLRDIFPDEISKIDKTKYKKWIERNISGWKERNDSYHMEKLIYGITKN
ncbi:MAG: 4Fe-4S binding protein [Candidatus Thorarchaeota archaeon]